MKTKTASRPAPNASTARRISEMISYAGSLLAACAIIMWSVFNTFLNLLTYRAETDVHQDWKLTGVLVLAICVVPFFFGLVLLTKTLNRISPKTKNQK